MNAMDGSVIHIAVGTEMAVEVLKPTSVDGCIVRKEIHQNSVREC